MSEEVALEEARAEHARLVMRWLLQTELNFGGGETPSIRLAVERSVWQYLAGGMSRIALIKELSRLRDFDNLDLLNFVYKVGSLQGRSVIGSTAVSKTASVGSTPASPAEIMRDLCEHRPKCESNGPK